MMTIITNETQNIDAPSGASTIPALADYTQISGSLSCQKGGRGSRRSSPEQIDGLVTVITVVLNCAKTLPKTLESIRSQTYRQTEHIIVDGGSDDGSLEIIKQHESDIDLWISEPDAGISDAFNKGIALATGEYIALVNADDWLEPNHFDLAIDRLKDSNVDFTFGNLTFHDSAGIPLYTVTGDPEYTRRILHAMPAVNHPSIVCRRALFEHNGLFDKTFRIAMDYEWLLRNHIQGARGVYLRDQTSHMGADGVSQRRILESLREVRRASTRHGYSPGRAQIRYWARATKVKSRLLIEQRLSTSLAKSLRAMINPHYRKPRLTRLR